MNAAIKLWEVQGLCWIVEIAVKWQDWGILDVVGVGGSRGGAAERVGIVGNRIGG